MSRGPKSEGRSQKLMPTIVNKRAEMGISFWGTEKERWTGSDVKWFTVNPVQRSRSQTERFPLQLLRSKKKQAFADQFQEDWNYGY